MQFCKTRINCKSVKYVHHVCSDNLGYQAPTKLCAQAEIVNAALVSVGQTAATRNGRELLVSTPLVALVSDRALSSTGRPPR
jgi:hypothetical protein